MNIVMGLVLLPILILAVVIAYAVVNTREMAEKLAKGKK